jgi:hypothetical protein
VASYRKNVRLHLAPHIGAVPLAALTTARIDALYRQLERGGRADHKAGEGLSPRTVRYVHTILSAALSAAVKHHRLARNPAAAASPPSARQARAPEMHAWTAEQLAAFLGWSAGSGQHHAGWRLLAYTGTRRGEALALRWRDVNLDAGTVSVRRSAGVIRVKGEGAAIEEGDTKAVSRGWSISTPRRWLCCGRTASSAARSRSSSPAMTPWCSATRKGGTCTRSGWGTPARSSPCRSTHTCCRAANGRPPSCSLRWSRWGKRNEAPGNIRAASRAVPGWPCAALTCVDVVSEGGLEPFAYITAAGTDPWLSV